MPGKAQGRTVLQKYVPLSDAGMEKSLSLSDELVRTQPQLYNLNLGAS